MASDGWLAGYKPHNVVAFPFFDVLTNGQASGLSAYASHDGTDSHPAASGNHKAATLFVPWLNAAVRRAGLAP